MDFVMDLPRTKGGHDVIWVVVDRLIKSAHFLTMKKTDSLRKLAQIYIREIIRLHRVPVDIVSDRDPRFVFRFWKCLHEKLGEDRRSGGGEISSGDNDEADFPPEMHDKFVSGMEIIRYHYWPREPIARSVQEQIVNALHLGERSRASHLLSELGSGGQALQAGDFISILQYCARTPDPLFVMETWKHMEEKDIDLSGKCYLLTIQSLCKGGYLKEAFKILSIQRENSDIYPTLPVYNNLLEACVETNSLNHASECLNLMEQQGVGKNAITYNLLLKLAVLQQDLPVVRDIWKEYINCHSPSIITVRKFIRSFTRLRDLESASVALQQMIAVAFQQKDSITKTAEGRLFDSRLDIPIPFRDDLARNRYGENSYTSISSSSEYYKERDSNEGVNFGMEAKEVRADGLSLSKQPFAGPVMKLLRWSFGDIIHTCANSKNVLLAEQLMLQMQNLGLEPSCGTYDGFIRALVAVKGLDDAMEVLKVMQQKNMKPYDSTLAAISVSCSRGLELDLAETFLAQISKCHLTYPFNAFLEACDTLDQPERAVGALAKMKYLNLLPDIRTYELLFSLFGNVNAPYEEGNMLSQIDAAKRITAIEMDMTRHGIQHSHISMQNLLKALGMEGMTKEMIQYLRVAENQFLHRSIHLGIHIYNTVLHSLVEAKESLMAVEIFKRMISCGLPPDAATYNIMIDCCSNIKCYRSACALISMMIRDGFYPHAVTYTALIKILLNFEDFDEALKLLDQASSEGIQPDLVLYNTILQAASQKGRIDVIELIVEQMHREKIQPDPSTCSHVFNAYVDNGPDSTAMEALQVLSMRMISEHDSILEEKRLEYENLIFDEDVETESQIIEIFKDSAYIAVALLYLRWCATLLFPISWLPNQSPWAKRLSSNYASRLRG
ncbi:hypothetical protein DH2020_049522 [Rehmannia glutinosa]|uniref:Pentatricopeptide repeat-containing protein n=1 Tax=Rehmannia glutinosa TaxID=99300 RepID=A0ABR0U375_REHGL